MKHISLFLLYFCYKIMNITEILKGEVLTMQHLAIVPDGNRRWAKQHKLETVLGHKTGMDTVKHALAVCLENKIKYLSFYTFSLENFKREEAEKSYLFSMLAKGFTQELPTLIEHGIKVRFIGDRSFFPPVLESVIDDVETATAQCDDLHLNLLFCYGGKSELVHAARALARQVSLGQLDPDAIDETMLGDALWTKGIPDPDLIIRTGGAIRLSNLLLFQAAYSELMFLDCYWPEVTKERLQQCITDFAGIKRNFGK